MRLALAGGGTGGHLSPGIAVAEQVRQLEPAASLVCLCGWQHGERQMLDAAGLDHVPLGSSPFPYGLSPRGVVSAAHLLGATVRARGVLRRLQPGAVLGVGGYASVPVVAAARLLGIPAALLVLDAQPDRANRLLSRWATWIAVAFPAAQSLFPAERTEVTGCPVRRMVLEAEAAAGRRRLGLDPSRLTLLVMGGSQGARRINQALVAALPGLLAGWPVQVVHLIGERDFADIGGAAGEAAATGRYIPLAFEEQIGPLLAAADLVVGRAGANSTAECAVLGKPQLLIPYPHAGAHQSANARALVEAGAAVMLEDAACDGPALEREIAGLLAAPERRAALGEAARRWSRPGAAQRVARVLLSLAEGRGVPAPSG